MAVGTTTCYVSVGLATGLWAAENVVLASPPAGKISHGEDSFRATELSGVASSASLVSSREISALHELLTSEHEARATVESAVLRQRDIDGSTLLVQVALEFDPITFVDFAAISDLVKENSAPVAARCHAERDQFGYQPFDQQVSVRGIEALWTHTIIVCGAHESNLERCLAERASALLPSTFVTARVGGCTVYAALHATLVCAGESSTGDAVAELIDELHGWWNATWLLDEALLHTTRRVAATLSIGMTDDFKAPTALLASVTARLGVLSSRLDSFRIGLGGFDWPIWDAATARWGLDDNLRALTSKRAVLIDMLASFRQAVDTRQAERLNQIASFFAVLSSVASFVAVVLFMFPTLQDGSGVAARLVVVLASFGACTTAILWSSRLVLRLNTREAARQTR